MKSSKCLSTERVIKIVNDECDYRSRPMFTIEYGSAEGSLVTARKLNAAKVLKINVEFNIFSIATDF